MEELHRFQQLVEGRYIQQQRWDQQQKGLIEARKCADPTAAESVPTRFWQAHGSISVEKTIAGATGTSCKVKCREQGYRYSVFEGTGCKCGNTCADCKVASKLRMKNYRYGCPAQTFDWMDGLYWSGPNRKLNPDGKRLVCATWRTQVWRGGWYTHFPRDDGNLCYHNGDNACFLSAPNAWVAGHTLPEVEEDDSGELSCAACPSYKPVYDVLTHGCKPCPVDKSVYNTATNACTK
jgi:hypothetical protein